MDQNLTLPEIMKLHHTLIEGFLNKYEENQDDSEDSLQNFNKFKWELKKHFIVEEKAIFTFIDSTDFETYDMKNELLKEHRKILQDLKEMENIISHSESPNLQDFSKLLKQHKCYEDDIFYPKLVNSFDIKEYIVCYINDSC